VTKRCALYARISEDPLGLEEGVERQLADCRDLARSRGWSVVAAHRDNGISAYKGGHRPGYAALMAQVEASAVDQVVVYMTSRLWRNASERVRDRERLRKAAVGIAAVRGPDLDFSSANGRMLAGILGEVDEHESGVKAERVARAAEKRAQDGQPNGAVPFGWRREQTFDGRGRRLSFHDVEEPNAAEVVREIVARLLVGDSLNLIARDLTSRGAPSPRGKGWIPSSVRKVALRPGNAALRVHQGEVLGPAAWPALINEDKHARVTALLGDPARRHSKSGAIKHLLSFGTVARCGVCGERLRVAVKGGNALYVCNATRGCVGRRQERVDAMVEAVAVERLSRPDALALVHQTGGDEGRAAHEQAEGVRAKLAGVADDYTADLMDRAQFLRMTAGLRERLSAAEALVAAAMGPTLRPLDGVAGPAAGARWAELGVLQRRAILEAMGMRVRIMPTRQGAGFDPQSVKITWS